MNWCEQFGLTEEEKGRDNQSVNKSFLTSAPLHEVQLSVSLPTMASGNSLQEHILSFEALSNKIQSCVKTLGLNIVFQPGSSIKIYLMGTNAHFLEHILNYESLQHFLGEQYPDQ